MENEELSQHLVAAKDAQRQLTTEVTSTSLHCVDHVLACSGFNSKNTYFNVYTEQLQELEEKYSECIEMLHEAQEELKNLRNRNYPAGTPRRYHPLGLYPMVRVCVCACMCVCRCVYMILHEFLCVAGFSGS